MADDGVVKVVMIVVMMLVVMLVMGKLMMMAGHVRDANMWAFRALGWSLWVPFDRKIM